MVPRYEKLVLMIKVSRMYYEQDLRQQKIATKLGLSRAKVSRMLKEARKLGLVTISIKDPYADCSHLEIQLGKEFGLKEVVVVADEKNESSESIKRRVGALTASLLERRARPNDLIAVGWGTTLREFTNTLHPKKPCKIKVVPLIGGVDQVGADIHSNEIARKISEAFGGIYYVLNAPVIVDSKKARDTLYADTNIGKVLQIAKSADLAFIGIGIPKNVSTMVKTGYFSAQEFNNIAKSGAVGGICTNFYDIEGNICKTPLDDRRIGFKLQDLRKIKIVIGVASGKEKTEAVLGALRGKYLDILVINEAIAHNLIKVNSID